MDNQSFEVNLIEGLTSEHEEVVECQSDHEFDLESDDFNLDQIVEWTVEWATNTIPNIPLQEEQPLMDHTSSSELKAFPSHLKYQYLDKKEAFPVIITSHLTEKQEEDILAVLRENRGAISLTMADIKGISPSNVQHRIHLIEKEEEAFLVVLRENKEVIGWTMTDTKRINPSIMQHRIHLIEEANPNVIHNVD